MRIEESRTRIFAMNNGNSREDLIQFLDFLGAKGLMNPETAKARKASSNSLLSILTEEEAKDVSTIDLDHLTQRFLNLKGSEFKPESVKVYKSRVEAAIRDFVNYKKDPLSFRPKLEQRSPRSSDKKVKEAEPQTGSLPTQPATPPSNLMQTEGLVFPIPLRRDVTVKIAGIPPDLSAAEARKICSVITALSMPDEF
jgi:hypothetical protein